MLAASLLFRINGSEITFHRVAIRQRQGLGICEGIPSHLPFNFFGSVQPANFQPGFLEAAAHSPFT